jgi:hypothetical protein
LSSSLTSLPAPAIRPTPALAGTLRAHGRCWGLG